MPEGMRGCLFPGMSFKCSGDLTMDIDSIELGSRSGMEKEISVSVKNGLDFC